MNLKEENINMYKKSQISNNWWIINNKEKVNIRVWEKHYKNKFKVYKKKVKIEKERQKNLETSMKN